MACRGKCSSISARLNRRVDLQQATLAADGNGQMIETWADVYSRLPAEVMGIGGGELLRGEQTEAGIDSVVRIRYPRTGTLPTASMRVRLDGRTLNIARVLDKTGDRRELHLLCKEVG